MTIFTIVLFTQSNCIAQTIEGLELHLKPKTTELELYQELWLEAYLINHSQTTISLFKIGFSEPGWKGYQEDWNGTLNSNPLEFYSFRDAPTSRFKVTSIVEVVPGDSIYAGLLRHKISAAGDYTVEYTLSQDPAKINMGWAADAAAASKAKQISTYSVTSKPFVFSIESKVMAEVEIKEISEEELSNKKMFYNVADAFTNPSEVYKLTVSGTVTIEVMQQVCALKNLRVLYLRGISGISSLPAEISQLNLIELNCTKLENLSFPESMGGIKSLKTIYLENCSFTELPEFIVQLPNLESLSIRSCPITSLPAGIENMSSLKELELAALQIPALNPGISKLSSLEKLSIINTLDAFPDIAGFINLESFQFSNNPNVTELPASIAKLKKLAELKIFNTSITTIPNEIANLKNLRIFDMQNNNITAIPASLYECTSLEKINLQNNEITTVAPGINKLVNLKEFVAYKNRIEALPQGLSKCMKLERVNVHTNMIKGSDKEGMVLERRLGSKYRYKN